MWFFCKVSSVITSYFMSEFGDLESFSAPQAKESSEQSDEQFGEQMRAAQAAAAQLKKEEGKARQNDDQLAKIIVQFLSQQSGTEMFLLISRCVSQDIPSEIIIAILSLVDEAASKEIERIVQEMDSGLTMLPEQGGFEKLAEAEKRRVEKWLMNIKTASFNKPHRTLDTILSRATDPHSGQAVKILSPSFLQLSTFILRNFIAKNGLQEEYEVLKNFLQSIYVKMVAELETLVAEQKQLS